MCDAHSLRYLHHDAAIEVEFLPLSKLMVLFPVSVANSISRLVIYHDPAIEGVKFEVAILPSFLLSLEVVRVKTFEFSDRRCLRRGECGGVRRTSKRSCHRVRGRLWRVICALVGVKRVVEG